MNPKQGRNRDVGRKSHSARDGEDFQEILRRGGQALTQQQLARGHPFVPIVVRVYIFVSLPCLRARKRKGLVSLNPTGMAAVVWQGWECRGKDLQPGEQEILTSC